MFSFKIPKDADMANQFKLESTNLSNYPFISLSVDYSRIDEYLNEIAGKLSEIQYKGKVLFDLLISNGLSNDRFYEAYFDGCKFDLTSFVKKTDIPPSILDISYEFYINNLHVLDNSVLTKPQKFLFKKTNCRKNMH
jgi:hypothetical protein